MCDLFFHGAGDSRPMETYGKDCCTLPSAAPSLPDSLDTSPEAELLQASSPLHERKMVVWPRRTLWKAPEAFRGSGRPTCICNTEQTRWPVSLTGRARASDLLPLLDGRNVKGSPQVSSVVTSPASPGLYRCNTGGKHLTWGLACYFGGI